MKILKFFSWSFSKFSMDRFFCLIRLSMSITYSSWKVTIYLRVEGSLLVSSLFLLFLMRTWVFHIALDLGLCRTSSTLFYLCNTLFENHRGCFSGNGLPVAACVSEYLAKERADSISFQSWVICLWDACLELFFWNFLKINRFDPWDRCFLKFFGVGNRLHDLVNFVASLLETHHGLLPSQLLLKARCLMLIVHLIMIVALV